MSEYHPPEEMREGHLPDLQVVILDLYRLLTIFLSSKQLAEMRTNTHDDPVGILQQFEESEITRILINSAVVARIIDERGGYFLGRYETNCGTLVPDVDTPETTSELNLREACNKIIHAKKINFDLEQVHSSSHMTPTMYFYGSHGTQNWKASVSIVDFITTYTAMMSSQ